MTFGRSFERHLEHLDLPTTFTEWVTLAQDRAAWHKLVTQPPFAIGKPFLRKPRGDTRVTPEDRRRNMAQRTAEIAKRRAAFHANTDQQHTLKNHELFPLGGARKCPSNCLPRTGGAL